MTRTRFFFVAMAAVAVGMPMQVHAHWSYFTESACSQSNRLDHKDVDCLHGEWHQLARLLGGARWGLTSYCSEYGTVVASVDVKDHLDDKVYLGNTRTYKNELFFYDVRAISCCINESDLCYRKQARAEDGRIMVYEDGVFRTEDVSTQQKRYEFCQANADNIYCKSNPSANRRPYNLGDCVWHWNQSYAARISGCVQAEISISRSDGRSPWCHVEATCPSEDGPVDAEILTVLWDFDDLFFCDHRTADNEPGLQVGQCPEEPGVVVN